MRLDLYLVEKGFEETRNRAQYSIKNGLVFVNNKNITKASYDVSDNDSIEIKGETLKYVSKGGLKLERALEYYKISPSNKVCLDIGASTGGFTDCLIKNNAKEVISIDTGTDQLHESLKTNPKVHSFEQTNFLDFDFKDYPHIELVVIDVSFVKVETILERLCKEFKDCTVISLIKPQFELGNTYIKNGVVKDPELHKYVLNNIKSFLKERNVKYSEIIESPILGGSGNKEFLISFNL